MACDRVSPVREVVEQLRSHPHKNPPNAPYEETDCRSFQRPFGATSRRQPASDPRDSPARGRSGTRRSRRSGASPVARKPRLRGRAMSEPRRGLPDRQGAHRAGDLGSAAHRRWKCPNWVGAGQTAAPWEGGRASGSVAPRGLGALRAVHRPARPGHRAESPGCGRSATGHRQLITPWERGALPDCGASAPRQDRPTGAE